MDKLASKEKYMQRVVKKKGANQATRRVGQQLRKGLKRIITMAQFNKLTRREWEVVELLLKGKSNKLIASSLGISTRTVEFHLKNIYAKFQVSSRIELILKLGNSTGKYETRKLGYSTVDGKRENTENRDRLNSRMDWDISFRDSISIIGEELEMKNLLHSKHMLVGMITALITGSLWIVILSPRLFPDQIMTFITPLIIIWLIIGFSVGVIGKHRGSTLVKVGFSALLGTGLTPLTIIPLMVAIVLPVGRFAERLGFIDSTTMPGDVALTLSASIMSVIWLIVGVIIGIIAIGDIKKPESPTAQSHALEDGS